MKVNLLKGLKHNRAGFFIWSYYSKNKHIRDNIKEFLKRVYRKDSLVTESRIESLLLKGETSLEKFYPDPNLGKSTIIVVDTIGTSAFPGGDSYNGIQFERKGMVSMALTDYDSYIDYKREASVQLWFKTVDVFIDHFQPIYGHGHIQFNKWIEDYPRLPPPETRIWPYNLFNIEVYPQELLDRLNHFIEDNSEEWLLRNISDCIVELRIKDLRTKESEIDSEVTRAILGEGDDLLTPNVGYPPPKRWWD